MSLLSSTHATIELGDDAHDRAVVLVGEAATNFEHWLCPARAVGFTTCHLALSDEAYAIWPDRDALAILDELAGTLAAQGAAEDSIALVGVGEAARLAWLVGCTSTRFAAIGALGATPIYAELSEAKPFQPIEMTLNLDRALLCAFPEAAEHLALVREQLDAGSKDYEWLAADVDQPAELARFLDERL